MVWILLIVLILLAALLAAAAVFFGIGICRSGNLFKKINALSGLSRWQEAEKTGVPEPDAAAFARMTEEEKKKDDFWDAPNRAGTRTLLAHHPERVTITSRDGLTLCGHYVPVPEPKAVILMVHGYHSCSLNDFACAAPYFLRAGCACLLVDQRSHEESAGAYICYGVKEKEDVKLWAEYLAERFPNLPVIMDGVSMGAATVMLAAGLELPQNVRGIISDCGYTSPYDIFVSVLKKRYHLPPFPLLPVEELFASRIAGIPLRGEGADTRFALRNNRLPILFAHGEADGFVPYAMGRENYDTARRFCNAEFLSVPEADHGLSFLYARREYLDAVNRLFARCGVNVTLEDSE